MRPPNEREQRRARTIAMVFMRFCITALKVA